jgi:23S rRNA (cytosine1962-C5)-methyltransferase
MNTPGKEYELIDSGEEEKLERFGDVVLSRPDPQALWPRRLSKEVWAAADGVFFRRGKDGEWRFAKSPMPKSWPIEFGGLKFLIKPTAFKHVGLFPEQAANWDWLRAIITQDITQEPTGHTVEVLNLFGYTGGATLACAQAGAKVVHVDGSKSAIAWARENAALSGLADRPIRWILDDARAFVEREIKRGREYDGIIMDPPSFGHGADKELWKIEEHFLPLLADCMKILKPKTAESSGPLFFIINGYSAGYSATAYGNNLLALKEKFGGTIETGELMIHESKTADAVTAIAAEPRSLPAGIFARWSKK